MRPLPYRDPDRLVRLYEAHPASAQLDQHVSEATFHEWREGAASIESAALVSNPQTRFLAGAEPQPVTTMRVSPAFLDVLGVPPLLGTGFSPERTYSRRGNGVGECVLSYAAWQRIFGGRPDVIGATFEFIGMRGDDPYRVIGVMPASFRFASTVDIWTPLIVDVPIPRVVRTWRYDRVVARLRPGATIDRARAELGAVSARLAREFPASNAGWTVTVTPLHDAVVGRFARASWLMLAAVGVVLLVACLNVGGLLIARGVARERETAVRAALGAGSWRLIRLWLAEATCISAIGAAFGLLLAWLAVSALKAAAPPGIPRIEEIAIDAPTLAVAAIATVLAVVIFTIAPLWRTPRGELVMRLRAGSEGAGDSARHGLTRGVVMMAQCAGAATLVVIAVMLTRSFIKLTAFDLGWDAAGVVSMTIAPRLPSDRPWVAYVEWADRLTSRLASTPGLTHAAITTQVPLGPEAYAATLARSREDAGADVARWTSVGHNVTDGYFALMGIRVVSGRAFGDEDRLGEAAVNRREKGDRGAAIVSERTARLLWPDRPAVGQWLRLPDSDNVKAREVIGVVEDIQFHEVGESPALHVFIPWTQTPTGRPRLLVKGTGSAAATAAIVRDVVRSSEPSTGLDSVAALDALVSRATAQPRFTSRLVSAFGALALMLAASPLHGLNRHGYVD